MSRRRRIEILSVPYDAGNVVASGARSAPATVVGDGAWLSTPVHFRTVALHLGGGAEMHRATASASAAIVAAGSFPLVLGGDHSISLPIIESFCEGGTLSVLWLDAHTDFDAAEVACLTHKNVLRRISELPFVERIVVAGHRGFTSGDERSIECSKLTVLSSAQVRRSGTTWLIEQLPHGGNWYVSIDIDVLDPNEAPATPTAVPEGWSWVELRNILDAVLVERRVVGLDLVEIDPELDIADRTVTIARLLLDDVAVRATC